MSPDFVGTRGRRARLALPAARPRRDGKPTCPRTRAAPGGAGHHPDFTLKDYREVHVTMTTHSIRGLHRNDFIVAAKIDQVPVVYSPKFKREHPVLKGT